MDLRLSPQHLPALAPLVLPRPGDEPSVQASTRLQLDRGCDDWVYLPVDVPDGVNRLHVAYSYDRGQVPDGELHNAVDLGLFDERGIGYQTEGFRGWSGGARTEAFVSADEATPGYLPGTIRPGRWHVAFGPYTLAPGGAEVDVTVTATVGDQPDTAEPDYPPSQIRDEGGWYAGDCHVHTVYSDGRRPPSQAAASAREQGLDFLFTTEHNTAAGHRAWSDLAGPDLLVGMGEEVTTRNGHWLALGLTPGHWIDWRFRGTDRATDEALAPQFDDAAALVRSDGGLVVAAHPFCPIVAGRFRFGLDRVDAVEVWNGVYELDDEAAVQAWDNELAARGPEAWVPAMGNSDSHTADDPLGHARTVVRAQALSVPAIVAGLKAGTSWVTHAAGIDLTFGAATDTAEAGIGERLRARPGDRVTVTADVSGVPDGLVLLWTDEGLVYTTRLNGSPGHVEWTTTSRRSAYVRLEVRYPTTSGDPARTGPNPMAALTNPVWLV